MGDAMASSDPATAASTQQLTQDSISALEYLTQQEELESSARDILPYSFQRCTAPLGPMRQALYACLTCSPVDPESQRGGICYSCSIQCHGSHNLVELFCKRDFTCDCGTTRMGTTPCSLRKVALQSPNAKNEYNHNFEGRFCDCDQVYDVDAEEGTMFQCLVCEDWFHEKCIGEGRVPDQDDFDGFVCKNCVGKNEWFGRYVAKKDIFMSTLDTYPEVKVDVGTSPTESQSTATTQPSSAPDSSANGVKRSLSTEPDSEQASKRVKVEDVPEPPEPCNWAALPPTPSPPFAMFLKENFRDHLCRCITCEMTRLRTLPMISREEETYEPEEDNSDTGNALVNQSNVDSLLDAGTKALSSLPRTQALDGIVAYQTLSTKLKTFFQGFVQSGKVVSEADVRGFFAEMQGAQQPVGNGIPPDSRREESAK